MHLLDPVTYPVALGTFAEKYQYMQNKTEEENLLHSYIVASHAIIIVTPEYNHSFSGVAKNIIDKYESEYAGKVVRIFKM